MSENNDFGMKLKSYRKHGRCPRRILPLFWGSLSEPIKTMSPDTATHGI